MRVNRLQLLVELLDHREGVEALCILEERRHCVAKQSRIEDLISTLILASCGYVLFEQRLVRVLQFLPYCLHDIIKVSVALVVWVKSLS